ncbi:SH3 domain-containing protein [Streptomyces sp. NBC_00474]|uniref:SH3 domain-containing protein n=1 Tax=Streptomyces sp. NBC_00474 TaxID=2975754 RepID=UPI002255D1EC|nr:SH3 domain-containing protein [Streptomyces sp. NBC_00474]MCX5050987.1 SH3 domain-containing protein [Streptomyces sp. NBC_00474]
MRIAARIAAGMASAAVLIGGAAATAPAASAAEMPCVPRVNYEINANGVNFRTHPGTGYKSLGLLYKGDWGKKIDTKGSWIKLRLGKKSRTGLPKNSTGWVSKRYAYFCTPMQTD